MPFQVFETIILDQFVFRQIICNIRSFGNTEIHMP